MAQSLRGTANALRFRQGQRSRFRLRLTLRKSKRHEPGNLSVQLELFSQGISGVSQIESPGF